MQRPGAREPRQKPRNYREYISDHAWRGYAERAAVSQRKRAARGPPFTIADNGVQAALAAFAFLAARRRAIRPAAAAPNSMTIGGAGTSVPPLDPPDPPYDDELLLDDPLEPDDVFPPKLEELPEDVLDKYPPEDELLDEEVEDDDELDDEELDDDDEPELLPEPLDVFILPEEVDIPPVEVLTPPVEVEVLTPPVEVDTPPDVLEVPEPPDEDELLTPPVLLEVDEITTLPLLVPPPLLLPPEYPPKKPPPQPPPKPPEPPITTGTPPLPPSNAAGGTNGTGIGGKP